MNIWDELGIAYTTNVRTIKKAYAKRAAVCHPEDHPEEFQKLRLAYESALKIAQGNFEEGQFDPDWIDDGEETQKTLYGGGAGYIQGTESEPGIEDEQKEWVKAREIVGLAHKYASEQEREKERECLYSGFLQSIAANEIPRYSGKDKLENHDAWIRFLNDPRVLEALHFSGFVKRVENKIILREFHWKTARMIKSVLKREIPGELSKRKELQKQLEDKGKKRREVWGFVRRWLLLPIIITAVLISAIRIYVLWKEQSDYRSIENIEAFIEQKYQISCNVETAPPYIKEYYSKDKKTEVAFFSVTTEGIEGLPGEFRLTWDSKSQNYEDIEDDLKDKTIKMCAEKFGMVHDPYGDSSTINFYDTITEEAQTNYIEFLKELQSSYVVKNVDAIIVSFEKSILLSDNLTIKIEKDTVIDDEEWKKELVEWWEKDNPTFLFQ